jgi:hypothetical protein
MLIVIEASDTLRRFPQHAIRHRSQRQPPLLAIEVARTF